MKSIKFAAVASIGFATAVLNVGALAQETANTEAPDVVSVNGSVQEIQQINNEISKLNALTAEAEQRLKYLRAQNQIEQEQRQAKGLLQPNPATPTSSPRAVPAPEVALITGQGTQLRALMRYANGSSDEVWVGKRLPGGYIVHSISSQQVRLRSPEGNVFVAGAAAPIVTNDMGRGTNTYGAPGMPGPMAPGMPGPSQPMPMPGMNQ